MTGAAEAYRTRLAQVRELIEKFERQLAIHERRQTARPADWGFSGDLDRIVEGLTDVIPSYTDCRCESKHPTTCGGYAAICTPDGRLLCVEHAMESDSDPRDCLDLADGTPVDAD